MRTKAIGYVRVSTDEQTKRYGLGVQRSAITSYCKSHDLSLVNIYSDEGISGSNGLASREGLAHALAALERHEAAVLVVHKLDRLARDLMLQETTIARLRAAGASVVSVSEADIDSDDPTRVLVRQVLGAIGQYERALIRGRVQAGQAAKRAAGGYAGGRPAFGYKAVGGELVPDEHEQTGIALARDLRAQGRSLREIADALTTAGYVSKSGGRWSATQVDRILARRPAD